MGASGRTPPKTPRRGGFRLRLLLAFLIPIAILSCVCALLLEALFVRVAPPVGIPFGVFRLLLAAGVLLSTGVAVGLALHMGDRFTRPVAWLLRAIDAGQVRLLSQTPPPAAGWELGVLSERVRVLLRQNLSGATAMEELESLRDEIGAVLDAADTGELNAANWPANCSTHPLTRRLLSFHKLRSERIREADEGVSRLRGLLEQDWREETLAVGEIVKRAERCHQLHTQIGVELERLDRILGRERERRVAGEDLIALLRDLRLGIDRWRGEVKALLGEQSEHDRLTGWEHWIRESQDLLREQVTRAADGRQGDIEDLAGGLEKVSEALAGSGREAGEVSREATQLKRAWGRLGERLRTLTVRVGELQDGVRGTKTSPWEDTKGDAAERQ